MLRIFACEGVKELHPRIGYKPPNETRASSLIEEDWQVSRGKTRPVTFSETLLGAFNQAQLPNHEST